MILYKAYAKQVKSEIVIEFKEFEVLTESDHYYNIFSKGSPKRVRKNAKSPFASKDKKQALESLIHYLEGLKFSGMPRVSNGCAFLSIATKKAQNILNSL